jgi:signal transduction histidine kinase
LLVRFASGRTISNSDVRLEDAPDNPAAAAAPAGPRYASVSLDGVAYRTLTIPVLSDGALVGAFQAAIAQSAVAETARRVALTLGAAGLLALAIMLPLSYWATRRSLAPLRRMASDADKISHAEPGGRIAYAGPEDELGSLACTLNAMLERLEGAYEDQRRFVADASHELRTPVAIIRGNVELLRTGVAAGAGRDESLAAIEEESVRMTRLLDELLSLARFDSVRDAQFQPLNVRALLDETAARTRSLGDRRIIVEGGCDLWIDGNPSLFEQALVNLARNAIAHTAEGGRITFACALEAQRVRISVTDDGPGIPEADLSRVFDRFYRAPGARSDSAGGGAGLGLAITQRIVDLHGGTMRAENVQPHGARFVIEVPEGREG